MWSVALCTILAAAPGDVESLKGTVRLTRGAVAPVVSVIVDDDAVRVDGKMTSEIGRLQAATVELLGRRDGERFIARDYRILDVGGVRPLVGILIETGAGLALRDGNGTAIPLSVTPRSLRRLQSRIGAKLWVSGKTLVTGELKVLRYGILREPPKAAPEAQPETAPQP